MTGSQQSERRSQAIQAAAKEGGTEGTHVSVQLPEPTCGEWYRLDDGP